MTGLDDQTGRNDVPNMHTLGNAMSVAIQKFAQCGRLENEDIFVNRKISEIKEQSVNFRQYVNDSINQSDKLSKYAEEVVVFSVACADSCFTKDELLDFLRETLDDAKKNKADAENLKANISGVMACLTNIQNECFQYSNDIQKNVRMMKSNIVNELENREFKQKFYNVACKIGTGAAILGTATSIIAAPLTAGLSLTVPIVEGGLIIAGTTGAIALKSRSASRNNDNEIDALNKQLIIRRDEITTQVGLLNENLKSIIHESIDILNFWVEQITSLNELVERLERYDNQDEDRPSRLVSVSIQKKWNNVNRECKEYNRTVRAVLQTSNMVNI